VVPSANAAIVQSLTRLVAVVGLLKGPRAQHNRAGNTGTEMRHLLLALSLVVAFGLIGRVAFAAPTATAPPERLPLLVEQATTQFDLAFRGNANEGQARKQQLEAVVNAWRAAPRSDANNERLNNWLRAAIRSSMPGAHDDLPTAPTFAESSRREKQHAPKLANLHSAQPAIAAPTIGSSKSEAQTDPFQDDPAETQPLK
jgi:hypothetical protein